MRLFRTCLALCLALALRAAGTITATPGLPFPGRPVTFILRVNPDPFGVVQWSFGDGSTATGGNITTATYTTPGSYTVRAVYRVLNGGQISLPQVAQTQVRIADQPGAPFSLSLLRLRWEDGGIDASVPQGFAPLVAYLDLKGEGAGLLLAQWTVDGIPVGTFTRQLAFAGTLTLDTRDLLSLPTTEAGEHLVSLQILAPQTTFQIPVIRYFVHLDRGEAPSIDAVLPAILHPGDDIELQLTGRGLTPDTRLSFGKDIALVAPLRLLAPGKALARVYVSPSVRPGFRRALTSNRNGKGRGPAGLRIVPVEAR